MEDHVEKWISAYMDHELEEEDRIRVANHLKTCPLCQAVYEELLDIQNQVMTAYRNVKVSGDLEQRVLFAINSEAFESKPRSFKPSVFMAVLTGFFFIGLLLAAGSIGFRLVSVFAKVFVHLIYALGGVITSVPALAGGTVAVSLFMIAVSGLSLHRLLRKKPFKPMLTKQVF